MPIYVGHKRGRSDINSIIFFCRMETTVAGRSQVRMQGFELRDIEDGMFGVHVFRIGHRQGQDYSPVPPLWSKP